MPDPAPPGVYPPEFLDEDGLPPGMSAPKADTKPPKKKAAKKATK